MFSDRFPVEGGHCYVKMPSQPPSSGAAAAAEAVRIFDELPKATIVAVSRPEASDITPMLLSNTIEFEYKQLAAPLTAAATNKIGGGGGGGGGEDDDEVGELIKSLPATATANPAAAIQNYSKTSRLTAQCTPWLVKLLYKRNKLAALFRT